MPFINELYSYHKYLITMYILVAKTTKNNYLLKWPYWLKLSKVFRRVCKNTPIPPTLDARQSVDDGCRMCHCVNSVPSHFLPVFSFLPPQLGHTFLILLFICRPCKPCFLISTLSLKCSINGTF